MKQFDIKSRYTGAVIFTCAALTFADALSEAVRSGANLSGADLSGADLSGANLSGADLSGADLSRADLSGADLSGADLSRANLSRANLSRANLYGANLYGANLSRANLSGADLSRANLYGADLSGADLSGANLSGANLSGADLSGADLSGANLSGADLSRANLSRAKNANLVIARTRILPEGALVGWKKLRNGAVAQLHIPATAKRSHAFGRKCRAECAEVLAIFDAHGKPIQKGYSQHSTEFEYQVGGVVVPTNGEFSEDWQEECAVGIHFFITREEAEAY